MKPLHYLTFLFLFALGCANVDQQENTTDVDTPESERITANTDTDTEFTISLNNEGDVEIASNDESIQKRETFRSIHDVLGAYKVKPEVFKIDPTKANVIEGEKGTKLYIKANSFVFADSKTAPTQEIELRIKECYEEEDFMAEKLTTSSNGRPLETGGMIHIEATCDGEKLALKQFEEMAIRFPEVPKEDMTIFYGEEASNGTINWEEDECAKVQYPKVYCSKNKFWEQAVEYFGENYKLDKETMLALKDKNWSFSISFDDNGNVIGQTHDFSGDIASAEARKSAYKTFEKLAGDFAKELPKTSFPSWGTNFNFTCVSEEKFNQNLLNTKLLASMGASFPIESAEGLFYIGELGWVNLDRYLIPAKEVQSEKVKVLAGNTKDHIDIKIRFKDSRSLIPGTVEGQFYTFDKVPVGQEITVIASLCKGDKILLATKDLTVKEGDNTVGKLDFKACKDADDFIDQIRNI